MSSPIFAEEVPLRPSFHSIPFSKYDESDARKVDVEQRGRSAPRFGCSGGDAGDFFDEAVHSPNPAAHVGTRNYGGYVNLDLDRAIEQMALRVSPEERRNALQDAMEAVMYDLVWVPLYNEQDVYGLDAALAYHPRYDSFVRVVDITQEP